MAEVTGAKTALDLSRWGAVQRLASKETCLAAERVTSPWQLGAHAPTIVSFYSYKGGVGCSTLVAVVAAALAQRGDNVVVLDLDLEAPGQQTLFDAPPTRGVIDYISECVALGEADFDGLLVDVTSQIQGAAGSIHLAAAGAPGWPYVEKIARLDFVAHTAEGESPVQRALEALLTQIRKERKPDWILIDARTGIHDLGGLAMHALAHIDVLLARSGGQGAQGLQLCLEALARRRSPDEVSTLIVHALVPAPLNDDTSRAARETFRHDVYELFKTTLYAGLPDHELPAEDDTSAAHTPHPLPLDEALARMERLRDVATRTIGFIEYEDVVDRLVELGAPEEEE
jgi:cellulose biosynthesis protein BcsQ